MDEKDLKTSLSVFGTDNRIQDIEKIRNSVRNSTPSIGIKYDNGVVLVSKSWETDSHLVNCLGVKPRGFLFPQINR